MLVRKLTMVPYADIRMSFLYPWDGVVQTPFHSAWGAVAPGQTSQHHMHHEAETFFIARGRGLVTSNGEAREVDPETVIYFPPFTTHTLTNLSDAEDLLFLTVFWEDPSLGLGNEKLLQENGWEEIPAWMPPGTRIDLNREYFSFVP